MQVEERTGSEAMSEEWDTCGVCGGKYFQHTTEHAFAPASPRTSRVKTIYVNWTAPESGEKFGSYWTAEMVEEKLQELAAYKKFFQVAQEFMKYLHHADDPSFGTVYRQAAGLDNAIAACLKEKP